MAELQPDSEYDTQILTIDYAPDERTLRAVVDQQEKEMRQLDAEISGLEGRPEELHARRASVHQAYDVNKGLLASVRKLPPEILGEVFLYCLIDSSDISFQQAPLLLTRVCRRWQRIATGTPRLWTQLSLARGLRLDPCSVISLWLSHSGTLPINVIMDTLYWSIKWNRRTTAHLLVENFHRFRHFESDLHADLIEEMSQLSRPIHAPLLESFKLSSGRDGFIPISHLKSYICAPNLTTISFGHASMMDLLSFTPLLICSITLDDHDAWGEINPHSLNFLTSCDNISILTLMKMREIQLPVIEGHSRILLPCLEKLIIDTSFGYDPCPLLNTLKVPALRELRIESQETIEEGSMPLLIATLDSLLGRDPPLQRLSLTDMSASESAELVPLLPRLRNLHSLSVTYCRLDDSILHALTPGPKSPLSWLCPRL